MSKIKKAIESADLIAQPFITRLHFGHTLKHKTITGGCCTILSWILFLLFLGYRFYGIYNYDKPYITSFKTPYQYSKPGSSDPWVMQLNEGYKIMFAI